MPLEALNLRKPVTRGLSQTERANRLERARQHRIAVFGSFSGETPTEYKWTGEVLARHKLTVLTGGRLGPIKELVETAIKGKARNVSVIVEPWQQTFNRKIKGKAGNIVVRQGKDALIRAVHQRLAILQTPKVKAYLFMFPGKKVFSGTMMELHALVNAFTLESMTKQAYQRPILLVGAEWKPILGQIKEDYQKQWPMLEKLITVIESREQLETALS